MKVTRRHLLKTSSGVIFAPVLLRAASETNAVMATLSSYMAAARDRALPAEVTQNAKHHILDTFAAMISGASLPPGRLGLQFARAHQGEKVATVAASDILCGPIEAAMANGMLAHSDETDDSHAPSQSHPGCAVVPAALAAAENFGNVDGVTFLRAVTLGYDIGTRVTMTLGALPFQMETHHSSHSIAGTFGAAAAAASTAGLNAKQMRWVLDYASQQAAGIAAWQRDTEHIEKSLVFAGMPARNGVTAALLIQLGGTGVDDVFSGADNFLLAFAPKADPAGLVDKLGQRYEISRTNIKKWTVGSPIQAPLDAIENIRKQRPFGADQVSKVVVRLAPSDAKTVNDREMPDISLQHMVAVMLMDRTASFAAAHDRARMQDAKLLQERAKVELVPDRELELLAPKRVTIVEITFTDGTKASEKVDAVRGTAENPMTTAEVVAKARDLMTPVIGSAKSGSLIERVLAMETVRNIRELRTLLQTA
jgi:2-methylcitrate dehydratase PrpD